MPLDYSGVYFFCGGGALWPCCTQNGQNSILCRGGGRVFNPNALWTLWSFGRCECNRIWSSPMRRETNTSKSTKIAADNTLIFSSPGRSPGRAIVLPPASALALAAALAKSLTLKFFMWWARRCQANYPVPVTGLVYFYRLKKIKLDISCELSAWQRIHLNHQVLFPLKNNEKVFMNVVCCSRD